MASSSDGVLTRQRVVDLVREYGEAWVSQDSKRIASIFTADAEYCERIYDDDGTYRGHAAISAYWKRQVCRKQREIKFEHVVDELVFDGERQAAVVKWKASFENLRQDGSYSVVDFVQVAVLRFRDRLIQRLEEYWHSPTKRALLLLRTGSR